MSQKIWYIYTARFKVVFNGFFPDPPSETEEMPGLDPVICRTRHFKIYKRLGGLYQVQYTTSSSKRFWQEFDLQAGYEYKIELYDDYEPENGSRAIFEYDSYIAGKDCDPGYDKTQIWLKRYHYDSYPPNIAPPSGLANSIGNLTFIEVNHLELQDIVDSTIYFYDARNNIREKWEVIDEMPGVDRLIVRNSVNHAGQVTELEYPDGSIVEYDYNYYGLVESVGDGEFSDKYASYAYTPSLKIDSLVLGPNNPATAAQIVHYEYNAQRDWLTAINPDGIVPYDTGNGDHYSEILTYYSGGYNGASYYNGNISSIAHNYSPHNGLDPSKAYQFDYDERNRLLNAYVGASSPYNEVFSYEDNGRINQRSQGANSFVYHYQGGTNRINYMEGPQNPGNYAYDANGSLISDNEKGMLLAWNYLRMLRRADLGGEYVNFRYNGENRRIIKEHYNGSETDVTYYLWFGGNPIAEYYDDGSLKNTNIYSGKQLVANRRWAYDPTCVLAQHCPKDPGRCSPPGACEFVLGDVNGNGTANGLDVTFLVDFVKGGFPPPPPHSRADVNSSGDVNGLDVTYLINYFKGGPAPFCTYYTCSVLYYHISDHLGSTRVLVDTTGRMFAAYDYFVTGEKTNQTWVYRESDYQFIGNEFDEEAGFNMNYFGARYFDPRSFTFISIEPLLVGSTAGGKASGINYGKFNATSYTYSFNNPICLIDKGGEFPRINVFIAGILIGQTSKNNEMVETINDLESSLTYLKSSPIYRVHMVRKLAESGGSNEDLSNLNKKFARDAEKHGRNSITKSHKLLGQASSKASTGDIIVMKELKLLEIVEEGCEAVIGKAMDISTGNAIEEAEEEDAEASGENDETDGDSTDDGSSSEDNSTDNDKGEEEEERNEKLWAPNITDINWD